MGNVSVSLPADGENIDAADVNNPINAIVNEINGELDNANIAGDAAIAGSKLADSSVAAEKLGTPVAFLAVLTSDQSISSATFTKVNFNNEVDAGDNFDISTDLFTAPYDGWYSFEWAIADASNNDVLSGIYKNGSLYKRGSWQDITGNARSSVGSITIPLTAGDTIGVYGYIVGTSPAFRGTNGEYTYFSGYLVGRTD